MICFYFILYLLVGSMMYLCLTATNKKYKQEMSELSIIKRLNIIMYITVMWPLVVLTKIL